MPDVGQQPAAAEPVLSNPRRSSSKVWRNPALALLCLLAAAIVEWKLVNLPSGEVNEKLVVEPKQVLGFDSPASSDGAPLSFAYAPASDAERVVLDAYFERARLDSETLQAFAVLQVAAPQSTGFITYMTSGVGNSACATTFSVTPLGAVKNVKFSQNGDNITAGYRSISAVFEGADVLVKLVSHGGLQAGLSPCRVQLSVADWKQAAQGFLPINIVVPAGAPFRFHWQNLDDKSQSWNTKSQALPLLNFGSNDSFATQRVTLSASDGAQALPLDAKAANGSSLSVGLFGIRQNQLDVSVSGKGIVLKDGHVVSINVFEKINKYPLFAALLGAANLALIGWVRKAFLPERPEK